MAGLATRCHHVVMSPGSRSTPLVLAARSQPRLDVDVVLDERAAAFVALGMARASGRPAVLVCTSGSAGLHYAPAIAEAKADGVPLVVLTADRPPELHDCESPQTMNQREMFGVHAKAAFELDTPAPTQWLQTGRTAVALALGGRPGPVHINIAFRKPLWDPATTYHSVPTPKPKLIDRYILSDRPIVSLARHLQEHADGVIFCGAGPADASTAALVRRLSVVSGWPVLAAAASGVRFDDDGSSSCVVGYEAIIRSGSMPQPAASIELGRPPLNPHVLGWLQGIESRRVISTTSEVRHGLPGAVELILADVDDTLHRLLAIAAGTGRHAAGWAAAETICSQITEQCLNQHWEGPVAAAVAQTIAPGSTLLVAASMPIRDANQFARRRTGAIRLLANRGLNGIDGLIATAAGIARSEGRATLLIGDLAFRHDVSGLLAAAELGVRLDVVVVNNAGGGIFGLLPISAHNEAFEPAFVAQQNSQIQAIAAAAGAAWLPCKSPGDVRETLGSHGEGIRVLEIRTDRESNLRAHERYLEMCRSALARIDGRRWAT